MRVFRTILGMLTLTIGLPSLLAGAGLWAAMQHRDQAGAFSGDLQRLSTPGYAVVVEDVDRLLRTDAPFTRVGDTQLRLLARTQEGPAFLGLAPSGAVRDYLDGVPHSKVSTVDIGTGALPVATTAVLGQQSPRQKPGEAPFWTRTDSSGQIAWTPSEVRGGPYSLVVMRPEATAGLQVSATAELRPGWLSSSAWGLLTLGTLLVMVGMIVLAWPARRREIVYVVEPSQVPELMRAIGAPMPILPATGRPVGAHRPRSLEDARPGQAPAVMAWPPAPALTAGPGVPPDSEEYAAATAIPDHRPAPGEPLEFIGAGAASLPVSSPISSPAAEPAPAKKGERAEKRRASSTGDASAFQPSAVEAWVAETAPVRARETEAQATARLAEAARRRAAAGADKPGASSPASPRTSVPAMPSSVPGPVAPVAASAAGSVTPASSATTAPEPETVSAAPLKSAEAPADEVPTPVDAVAAAYAAGAADARAVRGEAMDDDRDPRVAAQKVSVVTGPEATDWAATGMPRPDASRAARPSPQAARPSPPAGRPSPSRGPSRPVGRPSPAGRSTSLADSPAAGPAAGPATGSTAVPSPTGPTATPAGSSASPTPPGPVGAAKPARPSVPVADAGSPTVPAAASRSGSQGPNPAATTFPGRPAPAANRRGEFADAGLFTSAVDPAVWRGGGPAGSSPASAKSGEPATSSAGEVRPAGDAGTDQGRATIRPVPAPETAAAAELAPTPAADAGEETKPADEGNAAADQQKERPGSATGDDTRKDEPGAGAAKATTAPAPPRPTVPRPPSPPRPIVPSPARPATSGRPAELRPATPVASSETGSNGSVAAVASANPHPARISGLTPAAAPTDSAHAPGRGERAPADHVPSTASPAQRPKPAPVDATVKPDPAIAADLQDGAAPESVPAITADLQDGAAPESVPVIDAGVEIAAGEDSGTTTAASSASRRSGRSDDRDLLAQAQSRVDGGPAAAPPSRLSGAGAGRPAPAAWRKAAQSVAARAAAEAAGSEPAADMLVDESDAPEAKPVKPRTTRARATKAKAEGDATAADKPVKATKAAPAKTATAAKTTTKTTTARTTTRSTAAAKSRTAAAKPATAAKTAKPAAAAKPATTPKPATRTTTTATPRPTRQSADVPLRTSTGAIPAASGTPTAWLAAYQAEAAELLSGTTQRRRRRVTAPIDAPVDPAPADPPSARRRAAPAADPEN
ncbi:hypothetical protein [Actinoplanes solisilvae]|uniref:hypothetical protein n=1 Tax=Actinoplanes solisilvae TaxID=2486853 RepID=UPI000FD929E9|nr:hypothetical protein [Actinoplanes solisilvae]